MSYRSPFSPEPERSKKSAYDDSPRTGRATTRSHRRTDGSQSPGRGRSKRSSFADLTDSPVVKPEVDMRQSRWSPTTANREELEKEGRGKESRGSRKSRQDEEDGPSSRRSGKYRTTVDDNGKIRRLRRTGTNDQYDDYDPVESSNGSKSRSKSSRDSKERKIKEMEKSKRRGVESNKSFDRKDRDSSDKDSVSINYEDRGRRRQTDASNRRFTASGRRGIVSRPSLERGYRVVSNKRKDETNDDYEEDRSRNYSAEPRERTPSKENRGSAKRRGSYDPDREIEEKDRRDRNNSISPLRPRLSSTSDSSCSDDLDGLEKKLTRARQKMSLLKEEQRVAHAEASKAKSELLHMKADYQKVQSERRQLRAELRTCDNVIEEKDQKIASLEKAVESHIDKANDSGEELRREVRKLKDRIEELEDELESRPPKGSDDSTDSEAGKNGQRQLQKQKQELDERERQLEKERKRIDRLREAYESNNGDGDINLIHVEELNDRDVQIEKLQKKLENAKSSSRSGADQSNKSEAIVKLKEEKKSLKEQLKDEKARASSRLQKKNDTISYMQMELAEIKSVLDARESGNYISLTQELESCKTEAKISKSKYEGAQRRNVVLEEDIDHWKTLNCNLEDEVTELKTEVADWRGKYEQLTGDRNGKSDPRVKLVRRGSAPVLGVSQELENDSEEVSGISGLFRKLRTPTNK